MNLIPAKTIISNYTENTNWFGNNYNMNIYKGCCHGCIYCDSRSECYGVENFDEVRAKENSLSIIEKELKSKRRNGVVGTGAMSDPYNPFEKEYKLTRGALKLMDKYKYGVSITTKSSLVTRDIDILNSIKNHSPVLILMTITTNDDELSEKIEPNVDVTSKRFKAIKELTDNDIFTGILMMPILPFINDNEENIKEIIKSAHESGAKFIYPAFGVTLRQNQRTYYYQQLDKQFPNLKQKYINEYGNTYSCNSPNAKNLRQVFKEECNKYNILYKMPDIINGYKKNYKDKQISIFDL
ncbi:MAG: radical protein [Bacillota bacterium]|nr:radical protein [Bacillota bacterium]